MTSEQHISDEIFPCPICGEPGAVYPWDSVFDPTSNDPSRFKVICSAQYNGYPHTHNVEARGITKGQAIATWNRRAQPILPVAATPEAQIVAACLRGVEWRDENPSAVDYPYRHKAACDYADKALASPITEKVAEGWQPIETAPKDGTVLFAVTIEAQNPSARISWWDGDGWVRMWKPEKFVIPGPARWWPTHWMSLPAAPSSEGKP